MPMMRAAAAVVIAAVLGPPRPVPVAGYAPDTVLAAHIPRRCNCSVWATGAPPGVNASFVAALWRSPAVLQSAGAACAFPANAVTPLPAASSAHATGDGWCLCAGSSTWDDRSWTWCDAPPAAPSQINLVVINATAVAVNFVTADNGRTAAAGAGAAMAELRVAETAVGSVAAMATSSIVGFSGLYADPGGRRHLSYHHVILANLTERTRYSYRVTAGGGGAPAAAVWSDWFEFRSL